MCWGMGMRGMLTSKQQEEEVEAAVVEVLGEPVAAHAVAEAGDDGHEGAREVGADADAEQLQRHGAAAHHVRRLVVEELQLPDRRQHLQHGPALTCYFRQALPEPTSC